MKKAVSVIMLATLILTIMLMLLLNVQPVRAEWTGTIYIEADGSIYPDDAPITTSDKVTYMLTDNITNTDYGIIVERDNIIIDGVGFTIQGTGENETIGLFLDGMINVTVKNVKITNFDCGVLLISSSNNTFDRNYIELNFYGIYLYDSSNNIFRENKVTNNTCGIFVDSSQNNTFSENDLEQNDYGIYLYDSSNNIFRENKVAENNFEGFILESSQSNFFYKNSIAANIYDGSYLYNSSDNTFDQNFFLLNYYGVVLECSSSNTFRGNILSNNYYIGIFLNCSSNNIFDLNDVELSWYEPGSAGISLHNSSDNIFNKNDVAYNIMGIQVAFFSSYNTFDGNNIKGNIIGISIDPAAQHNTFRGNNVTKNDYGISFLVADNYPPPSNNNFHHNNFIDSGYWHVDFFLGISCPNVWDDGYPSGGNYWSDYKGKDEKSGPNQNQPGSDGIGDTPYKIDNNNIDHYPLVKPWSPDNIPPQTSLDIGQPKFVANSVTYLTSATPIQLIAVDNANGSGVALTAYRIYNASYNSGWKNYAQPFYLIGLSDGAYQIDFNSTDYAGNVEPTNTIMVALDNTSPTTTLEIGEPRYVDNFNNVYVSPTTLFTLKAQDNQGGSDVNSTFYRISNGTHESGWLIYSAPFNLIGLADGSYKIEYKSIDNLGNLETANAITVLLDNTPPTTALEIGEPKYLLNNIYTSSATTFTLIAEENLGGAGVASTFYRIYNSTYTTGWQKYSTPFHLTGLKDGEYSIDYYSVDNIGNTEPTNTVTVILDNTPPATTLTIGEPKYISDKIYVTPDTSFTLEAADAGSSVSFIAYRIFNSNYDSGWQTYTGPLNFASLADGFYTIEYYSIDNLGNVESKKSIQATLFSWNYIFTDSYSRGTTLKINLAHRFIQFITPDKDYGIREATYMRQCGRTITIKHYDDELHLITVAVDTKLDFCITIAWDQQTHKQHFLIDKPGKE